MIDVIYTNYYDEKIECQFSHHLTAINNQFSTWAGN